MSSSSREPEVSDEMVFGSRKNRGEVAMNRRDMVADDHVFLLLSCSIARMSLDHHNPVHQTLITPQTAPSPQIFYPTSPTYIAYRSTSSNRPLVAGSNKVDAQTAPKKKLAPAGGMLNLQSRGESRLLNPYKDTQSLCTIGR